MQAKQNFINTLNVQHDSSKNHFQIKHNAEAQQLPSQTEPQCVPWKWYNFPLLYLREGII